MGGSPRLDSTASATALIDDCDATLVIVTHEDEVTSRAQRRVRMTDGRLREERA